MYFKNKRNIIIISALCLFMIGTIGGIYFSRQGVSEKRGAKTNGQDALYQCPMHPTYTSDRPGDCAICGMALVLVGSDDDDADLHGIEGLAGIRLSDAKRQLIGVRTTEAEMRSLSKVVRTVGVVTPDETLLVTVNTKIDGWIENLFVDFTGQQVRTGQPLLSIFSRDLLATQEEYLLALKARDRLRTSSFPEISRNSDQLVERARERMKLWDIPESEIRALEASRTPKRTMTIRSPASGFVLQRTATEGMFVNAGQELYQIANLSRVWIQADIYEYELSLIRTGLEAKLTVDAYPGKVWRGRITYIDPFINDQTRTANVRFEFENPQMTLKPNMYANVEVEIPLGTQLVIPAEAIMDSGRRQVVFVDRGEGVYEPREVQVSQRVDDKAAINFGLFEGERVVTHGNFMIDSESRLKAALSDMSGQPADDAHAGH